MDVGASLRDAREHHGLTLLQVAGRTRIPVGSLEHLENNAFDRLPAPVYAKGHLRAYAAAVGLDPEEVVRAYMAQRPAAAEPPIYRVPAMESPHHLQRLLAVVVGIVVILLVHGAMQDTDKPATPAPVQGRRGTPVGEPMAVSPVVVAQADVPVAESGVRVEIRPTAVCWVSGVADGRLAIHRLMQGGERVALPVAREVVLRVGDPGAFVYTVNGLEGRPIGEAGAPVTVTITEQNFGKFVVEPELDTAQIEGTAA